VELALTVEVNGRPVATLMALPGMERELAVGFCLSSGLIASFADILLVHYCRDDPALVTPLGRGAVARLQARPAAVRDQGAGTQLVLSGCGSVELNLQALDLAPLPLPSGPLVPPAALGDMATRLRRYPGTYRRTGGIHAAALFAPTGDLVAVAEDVGRHNAQDKVLGAAVLRDQPLEDKVLLTTGRASHEMVTKALRMGVPVVGSFSVATSLAVQLAAEGHCTLLGRLRRERFLVYTHPERVG
jgi:FdhD protein